jgi:hypothetical protein
VAVLPAAAGIHGNSYLHPDRLTAGFHTAVLIAALGCVAGSVVALVTIRNPTRTPSKPCEPAWHCALDAPAPAVVSAGEAG